MVPTAHFTLTDSGAHATQVSGNFNIDVTQPTSPLATRKVWVTQQVSTKTELMNVYRSQIANTKATVPAVTGFSLRQAWDAYLTDKTILDAGKQIADENGLEFCFRFMAGRWTPDAILSQMGSNYTWQTSAGELFPLPFSKLGTAGNPVFEAAYEALLNELATWYDAHGCYLLHNSWWAMDWAELNNGAEVRAAPGYTQQRLIDGHKKLIDIGQRVQASHPNVVMEWPLSGYGPVTSASGSTPAVSPALGQYMTTVFGSNNLNCVFQANGWSNTGQWGTTASNDTLFDVNFSQPLARALQAIQPWGTGTQYPQYTATQITGALQQASTCAANYLEIYTPSLRSVNGGAAWATPLQTWVNGG